MRAESLRERRVQKRRSTVSNETKYSVKRDLVHLCERQVRAPLYGATVKSIGICNCVTKSLICNCVAKSLVSRCITLLSFASFITVPRQ